MESNGIKLMVKEPSIAELALMLVKRDMSTLYKYMEVAMEKAEMETTITYDVEEKLVRIFSAIRRDQGKLKRAGILPIHEDRWGGMSYDVPLNRFKWRVTTGKPSRRGFAARKSHTTSDITPGRANDGAS